MASNLTLAFIGCGNMGSAILSGILDATRTSTPEETETASPKISRFITSTRSAESAARLRARFHADAATGRLRCLHAQNVAAMRDADVVVLACKPFLARDVLLEDGVAHALRGKLVVSVLAGTTSGELRECIYGSASASTSTSTSQAESQAHAQDEGTQNDPLIVRTQPNVAADIRQSMTIIQTPDQPLPSPLADALAWMFQQIGQVKFVPADQFNAATMLVGASMAVMSIPLDGMLDAGVAEGVRRADGLEMVAQALAGLAGLLKSGVHPAVLRENISSPRGCTIRALLRLEREGVRGSLAQAVMDGVEHLGR
ncbi:pyrroline-5-carboxylate reductase [Aspergillus sp. HF37]|nr:pyrroline-5-carboxylate reductase [Aspergillus sp. HF37]